MRNSAILSLLLLFLIGCGNNGDGNKIELSGTVETTDIIISSQVAGEVIKIFKDDGNAINSGDTLMIIDPETYNIQLQQAKARRDLAKAQYALLKKGARIEDIEQAQSALKQAQANFNSAKADYERFKNLYVNQSITKKQFDDAETRLTIAEAQLKSAKENLKKIENIARPEEIEQARAGYEAAEANVKLLQKRVNDCYVLSPLEGRVIKNFVEPGENATPQSSLTKLSNLSEVEVVVYIQETDLGKVKLGQKAEIYSDSYENKAYEGKVTYISPEAEFTPKNIQTKEERTKLVYKVKLTVPNPDLELKSGMPVDAEIILTEQNT